MAGFAARKGVSQGLHDDLHVRAIVLEGPETVVAVLSASVLYLEQDVVDYVRGRAERLTGLPGDNIMMAATHTHSGPVVSGDYAEFLKEQCVACLVDAWERRGPGRVGVEVGHVEDVCRNRRRLEYGGSPWTRRWGWSRWRTLREA